MDWLIPLVFILLAASVIAPYDDEYDEYDECEDTYYKVVYSSGKCALDWTEYPGNLGNENNPRFCSEEGDITLQIKKTGFPTETVIYNIDWDLDKNDCECFGGTWTSLGGDKNCCGDDFETYETGSCACINGVYTCDCNDNLYMCEMICGDLWTPSGCCQTTDFCTSDGACYQGKYETDGDLDPYICTCQGFGWVGAGGAFNCCGDEISEFYISENSGDGNNSAACCIYATDCVDDGVCYASGTWHDIGDNSDLELCINNTWHDADESEEICNIALDPEGDSLDCDDCWVEGVESRRFGDYSGTEVECCGDDAGEYYIVTNQNAGCADSPTDFIHKNTGSKKVSREEPVHRFVTGYLKGDTSSGIAPLENTLVQARWLDFSEVNIDYTDSSGYYNISVPPGQFYLTITSPKHISPTKLVSITDNAIINQTLEYSSDCLPTCSRYMDDEFRCDRECDGKNGCMYDGRIASDFHGMTMRELCHNQYPDWKKQHNLTHEIICCSEGYSEKDNKVLLDVSYDANVISAQSFYAGLITFDDGKLYSMYVVVYDVEN